MPAALNPGCGENKSFPARGKRLEIRGKKFKELFRVKVFWLSEKEARG